LTQGPTEQRTGRALAVLYGLANSWIPVYIALASDAEVHARFQWPLIVLAAVLAVGLLQRFVVVWFAALILQAVWIAVAVRDVFNGDPVGLRNAAYVAFVVFPLFILVLPPLVRYVWKPDGRTVESDAREPVSAVSPVTGDTIVYGALHALAGCIFAVAMVLAGREGAAFAVLLLVGVLGMNVDALRGLRRRLQLSIAQAMPLVPGTPEDSIASRVAAAFTLPHGSRQGRVNVWLFRLSWVALPIVFPEMSPFVAGSLVGFGGRTVYIGFVLRRFERETGRRLLNERQPTDPKKAPLYYVTSD
jgi:hypothetical protein